MKGLRTRHWALHSHGALAGKSTFIAANCRAPIIVVDTDGRFEAVEGLVEGQVLYPEQVIDPLTLAEELIALNTKHKPATIAWDSLTKLYSIHARMGYMRGRSGRKTAKGKSVNKASELIDKSNAMTIARDLAILGTDVYFVWHTTSGVDGQGKSEVKDMISSIEKERLMTSINVTLEFMVKDGNFGVTVMQARDFGGRKSNVGFTMWDKTGNYWHGAAERLERLIYTSFASKEEMMAWGAERLSIMPDEAEGVYDHLKESHSDATRSQLTTAWIEHVDELAAAKKISAPEEKVVTETVAQEPEKEEVTNNGAIGASEEGTEAESRSNGAINGAIAATETKTEENPAKEPAESVAEQPTVEEVKKVAKAGLKMAQNIQADVEKIQAEEPKESVAETPPVIHSFDGELIEAAKKTLQETNDGGKTYLKHVLETVSEAVPWKYPTAEDVRKRVSDFPKLPDTYKAEDDQMTTMIGAEKLFDWLVFEA